MKAFFAAFLVAFVLPLSVAVAQEKYSPGDTGKVQGYARVKVGNGLGVTNAFGETFASGAECSMYAKGNVKILNRRSVEGSDKALMVQYTIKLDKKEKGLCPSILFFATPAELGRMWILWDQKK